MLNTTSYNPNTSIISNNNPNNFENVAASLISTANRLASMANQIGYPAAAQIASPAPQQSGIAGALLSLVNSYSPSSMAGATQALSDRSSGTSLLNGISGFSRATDIAGAASSLGFSSGALNQIAPALGGIAGVGSLISAFTTKGATASSKGSAIGSYIGTMIYPGVGTVVGGILGSFAGSLSGMFKSGKPKEQQARDSVRDLLQQAGAIDDNWCLTLANGSKYDIGKDGGAKLQSVDGTERRVYEIDPGNPLAAQVASYVTPLAAALTRGDPKLTGDFTGYFTNAAVSNATTLDEAKANVMALYKGLGIEPSAVA